MKTLFLTGGTSLLGSALGTKAPKGWKIILAEHKRLSVFRQKGNVEIISLDVTDAKKTSAVILTHRPHLVLHAAALSNVDFCQTHQDETWKVNVGGTSNLTKACEQNRIPLLFISSNAVFDGAKNIYSEKDKPNPINFYGKTKSEGEKIVQKAKVPWLIVRLMTMYGWQPPGARPNPVTWVLEKLKKGEKLQIVSDVYLNPLYNHDAASALWAVIEKDQPKNIYHVAGSEIVNRYQWTMEIAEVFGFDKSLISPVASSFFTNKIAPRPSQTIYSIEKIKRDLGIIPRGIRDGLRAMKKEKDNIYE